MAEVDDIREQLEAVTRDLDALTTQREHLVRAMLDAGAPITATAAASGLTRPTIYAIRDRA